MTFDEFEKEPSKISVPNVWLELTEIFSFTESD
jgi:hypothetical protein